MCARGLYGLPYEYCKSILQYSRDLNILYTAVGVRAYGIDFRSGRRGSHAPHCAHVARLVRAGHVAVARRGAWEAGSARARASGWGWRVRVRTPQSAHRRTQEYCSPQAVRSGLHCAQSAVRCFWFSK